MKQFMMNNHTEIRMSFFFGILLIIALWELLAPRRKLLFSKAVRWYSNLGIVFLNSLILQWIFPILAIGLAALGEQRKWGLMNNMDMPSGIEIIISILVMDCIIYIQHAMFHYLPLLWRLHRMHHADLDYDVTTGARFHPIEIMMSMGIKLATVAFLGPSAFTVLIFEIILNLTAMFNHGNIFIPEHIDEKLRLFVVTPDMHRVHHSVIRKETNSNFGFNFPWWDRIFGTYRAQPEEGHDNMTIGLNMFRDIKYEHLHSMLIQPFIGPTNDKK